MQVSVSLPQLSELALAPSVYIPMVSYGTGMILAQRYGDDPFFEQPFNQSRNIAMEFIQFVEDNGGRVLCVCAEGDSVSPAVAMVVPSLKGNAGGNTGSGGGHEGGNDGGINKGGETGGTGGSRGGSGG